MKNQGNLVITGSRKGIGRYLAEYYLRKGFRVFGCSRGASDLESENYDHSRLDVADERMVKEFFSRIRKNSGGVDIVINNAGIAAMNHSIVTPVGLINKVLSTNFVGTFLFCREAAKLMKRNRFGRIVNFSTVAVPLRLEGEAVYAASKAAVVSLTETLAREFAEWGITVNAVGPTPVKTDLIRAVPAEKIKKLVARQAIQRYGEPEDVSNVIDFFIRPESNFVTGQILYLGGL